MDGLVGRDLSVTWRRVIVILPAVVLLWIVPDVSGLLVLSQTVLSFGIPFALIPLVWFATRRDLMGRWALSRWFGALMWVIIGVIVAVCLTLVVVSIVESAV